MKKTTRARIEEAIRNSTAGLTAQQLADIVKCPVQNVYDWWHGSAKKKVNNPFAFKKYPGGKSGVWYVAFPDAMAYHEAPASTATSEDKEILKTLGVKRARVVWSPEQLRELAKHLVTVMTRYPFGPGGRGILAAIEHLQELPEVRTSTIPYRAIKTNSAVTSCGLAAAFDIAWKAEMEVLEEAKNPAQMPVSIVTEMTTSDLLAKMGENEKISLGWKIVTEQLAVIGPQLPQILAGVRQAHVAVPAVIPQVDSMPAEQPRKPKLGLFFAVHKHKVDCQDLEKRLSDVFDVQFLADSREMRISANTYAIVASTKDSSMSTLRNSLKRVAADRGISYREFENWHSFLDECYELGIKRRKEIGTLP